MTERQSIFEGAEGDIGNRGVVEEAVREVGGLSLGFKGVLRRREMMSVQGKIATRKDVIFRLE